MGGGGCLCVTATGRPGPINRCHHEGKGSPQVKRLDTVRTHRSGLTVCPACAVLNRRTGGRAVSIVLS